MLKPLFWLSVWATWWMTRSHKSIFFIIRCWVYMLGLFLSKDIAPEFDIPMFSDGAQLIFTDANGKQATGIVKGETDGFDYNKCR